MILKEKTSIKKQPKVLLVEDKTSLQKIHTIMLNALDCYVVLAKDGMTAIEYAQKECFDIIFMDINLPDISGIDVTKLIRQNQSFKSHKAFIVALTTCTTKEIKQECIDAGMDDVEHKPICVGRLEQICFGIES